MRTAREIIPAVIRNDADSELWYDEYFDYDEDEVHGCWWTFDEVAAAKFTPSFPYTGIRSRVASDDQLVDDIEIEINGEHYIETIPIIMEVLQALYEEATCGKN